MTSAVFMGRDITGNIEIWVPRYPSFVTFLFKDAVVKELRRKDQRARPILEAGAEFGAEL